MEISRPAAVSSERHWRDRRLHFLDLFSLCDFGDWNSRPLGGGAGGRSRALPKMLPHQSDSGPLKKKGTDKNLRYNKWTTSLEINTAAYIRGLHPKLFHIPPSTSIFWQQQKTPSISEQYELLISQP